MPAPTLTDSGQRLYDAIGPLMNSSQPGWSDAENGYAGAILCGALATIGLDDAAYVARDDVNTDSNGNPIPGWGVVFDADGVDAKWLPWLAQFVGDGDAVQSAPSVAAQRFLIKNPINFTRGRPSTIVQKVQTTLTGNQTVILDVNPGGAAFTLTLATYTSETPDPEATKQAALSVMPAWVMPTIVTVTGGDYQTLAVSHTTYSAMEAAHPTYSDIAKTPGA